MTSRRNFAARRAPRVMLATLIMIALSAPTASSQGVFETLFGTFKRPPTPVITPQVSSYAEPLPLFSHTLDNRPAGDVGGPWVAYCVRLCDGRFFPLARSFAISPAEQCRSFCPAAKTKIFGGNSINHAAAADGSRYANLDTAFLYRTRVVENCTCNGRDAFGLARMNVAADPTLRAGDIVAINGGFAAYTGSKSAARQSADFTPIDRYSNMSADVRRKLSETKVLPARQAAAQTPAPMQSESKPTSRADRRAQLLR